MTVHVDLDERKVVPMADHIQSNVADLYNVIALPCPEKAGRRGNRNSQLRFGEIHLSGVGTG